MFTPKARKINPRRNAVPVELGEKVGYLTKGKRLRSVKCGVVFHWDCQCGGYTEKTVNAVQALKSPCCGTTCHYFQKGGRFVNQKTWEEDYWTIHLPEWLSKPIVGVAYDM